jgi:short-subunit dehydrogenase
VVSRVDFVQRYGPWALVCGASEGIGAALSRDLAARGIHLVLVARRAEPLEALAAELSSKVTVRIEALDLGEPDVGERLAERTADLDLGLIVYNACHSVIGEFLDVPLADKLATLDVNCRGPVIVLSHLAPRLVARGRGGVLLLSSMSGFQGSAMVGVYAATKAFDTVLGEMLWEELGHHGVDVLVCAAGATRTPGFDRQTPADKRSVAFPMLPEQVAAEALAQLGRGRPTWVPGRFNRLVVAVLTRLLPRGAAVRFISRNTRAMYKEGT